MIKQYAKGISLVLALVVYFAGFWLIYGTAPGFNISGVLIVTVLWFAMKFVLAEDYREGQAEEEGE